MAITQPGPPQITSYRRDDSYNLTSHTFMVEFESLLYRGDGSKHREPVDSAFNVGCSAKLISQHLGHSGDLVLRGDDQRDHTGSITEERGQVVRQPKHTHSVVYITVLVISQSLKEIRFHNQNKSPTHQPPSVDSLILPDPYLPLCDTGTLQH